MLLNEMFPERDLYLFDTFDGFCSDELKYDTDHGLLKNALINGIHGYLPVESLKDTSVERVMERMPYGEKCMVKKGYFPDTAVDLGLDVSFALVSMDADLYGPTYNGLKFFYSRLSRNGYIIVHDYGDSTFLGVKRAVEQFCTEMRIAFVPVADSAGSVVIAKN